MEMLGLALAFPAVFIANVAYAALARFLLSRIEPLRPWIRWASSGVLALLLADVALVVAIGAVSARRALGPTYWGLHLVVVVLGAPAAANLLLVPGGRSWYHRWYVVAILCYIVGMSLVFFQIGVGDALFGPDGVGGPFATTAAITRLHGANADPSSIVYTVAIPPSALRPGGCHWGSGCR
jgi:hypothetical protein